AKFGVFVRLDETGADGLGPMRYLGTEYFHFDAASSTLMGADTGTVITLGQRVTVKLIEAAPVTGGLAFDLLTLEETDMPRGPSRGGPRRRGSATAGPRRMQAKAGKKNAKVRTKVKRRRTSSS
ncbi:MAG: ribonuclease R, partial [Rhodobacterales bacterium]